MGNLGMFLGGVVEQRNAMSELGLRERALGLQERQIENAAKQDLMARADKALSDSLGLVDTTIKSMADNPNVGTGTKAYADAIASVESAGSGGYGAIGPVTKDGDKAYGRYQVMGKNIPVWTKEILGRSMTPQEFLSRQDAQDAVFAAKFQQYIDQNGGSVDDAASMWFTGKPAIEGASLADVTGTTGAEYISKFNKALARAPQSQAYSLIEPVMRQIDGLARASGKNPDAIRQQVQTQVESTLMGVDKALAAGQEDALKKIGARNAYLRAGASQAEANLNADFKTVGGEGEPLKPEQVLAAEGTLRDDYTQLSKDNFAIVGSYGRMLESTSGTNAADMALVYNYMKMLDPGAIVTAQDQATASTAPLVPAPVRNLWNRLIESKSGTLLPTQRDEILSAAGKLATATRGQQQFLNDKFTKMAASHNLNPANIVVDVTAGVRQPAPGEAGNPTIDSILDKYRVKKPARDLGTPVDANML